MHTYAEEEVAAATVAELGYSQVVQEAIRSDGSITWTATGKTQLWLTARDGRKVCLPNARLNVTDSDIIIIITKDEAAGQVGSVNGEPGGNA
jgi:hypothetical protein